MMSIDIPFQNERAGPRHVGPLSAFMAVAGCVLLVLLIFWPTTWSMIEIWQRSSTFQHCYLVIPISLWLVWGERNRLAGTALRPFWPGLLLVLAGGAFWLLGVLADAQVVSQFGVIGLACATVLTVFGRAWVRVIWFPLLFLFFAVPFGEALVPQLMDWTADVTVAALRLSGVPVYREGVHFIIPSGQWSVIEACSGIKFLIASIMAGSLYAWLLYRSTARRLAFVGASILVPLLANWLRAYGIVMIGHLTNNQMMTGEDHIVFGWILFAAIMLAMFWIGTRWRQDEPVAKMSAAQLNAAVGRPTGMAALIVVGALLGWTLLAQAFMRPIGVPGPATLVAPASQGAWVPVQVASPSWKPDLIGSTNQRIDYFRRDGRVVGVFVGAFRHQTQAANLASSVNQIVASDNPRWKEVERGTATVDVEGVAPQVRSAEVRGRLNTDSVLVWQWYWTGNGAASSELRGKLALATARLTRQPDTALWVAVFTLAGDDPAAAARTLREFLVDMGPSLRAAFIASSAQ